MKLYLVQHGEARAETQDPQRPLTGRGEDEVRRVSQGAKRLNLRPSKILHSGKLRAKQTAEAIAEGLGLSHSPPQSVQGLNPTDDVRPWAGRISDQTEDLMLVGHLPFLEKLASYLLCGNEDAKLVRFQYGAIACLEQNENRGWAVRWILTPQMCAEVGQKGRP